MKKLLSAALLCFVLSSTLTSCSSDDDKATTPVETPAEPAEPTQQTVNTVNYNGTESPIEGSYYELVTSNYNGTLDNYPAIYEYPTGGYAYGYYVNLYGESMYHYALVLVKNNTIQISDNSIIDFGDLVLPDQTSEKYWAMAYVDLNGVEVSPETNNYGTGLVTVNSLAISDQGEGTTNLVSQFTMGNHNFNFIYEGDTFLTSYNQDGRPAGRNTKSTAIKNKMAESVKHLEIKKIK